MENYSEDDAKEMKRVCLNCVGEEFLSEDIGKTGKVSKCDYCDDEDTETITIEYLSDRVEVAFEHHFTITRSEPNSFEWAMMKDDEIGYDWEREGEPVLYAIANAAEINEEIAQDVLSILQDRHFDLEMAKMGDSGPFDEEQHYEEKGPNDVELREEWRHFEANLKSEARFFSASAEAVLDKVFENIADHKKRDGKPVIIEVGPKTEVPSLFRARVFQSDQLLEEAMMRPDLYLGPPPFSLASPGRMNAHGISIFYGATSDEVALGEVRPPVGSQVLTAQFELLRTLKLLDVAALRTVFVAGSVFDPNHISQLERAKFLQHLSDRITQPVMPDDQPFEYLITQVIADYLSSRIEPSLDGLAYPSAQVGGQGINVALFRKSSRVLEMSFRAGTSLSADCWSSDEDGPYPEYAVIEETATEEELEKLEADEKALKEESGWENDFLGLNRGVEVDSREPCLRVMEGSEMVHRVQAVQIIADTHKVRRHRWGRSKHVF